MIAIFIDLNIIYYQVIVEPDLIKYVYYNTSIK